MPLTMVTTTRLALERMRGWRGLALAGLAGYGLLLLAFRPASPFEWDEVLYQRALDHYDVAQHSPHPPGVPAFIAVGKAIQLVVRDPQLAMQLTAILSGLAAVLLVALLAVRLGATPAAAAAAACLLAVIPGFLFDANIGLSDVPATAGVAAAILACVVAARDSSRLPAAAAVVALALSLRPQVLFALLPAGLVALVLAVRRRRWRPVGLAAVSGCGVSVAVWAPAILLTGFRRYVEVSVAHAHWMKVNEWGLRLPSLALRQAVSGWLRDPLGSKPIAVAFWVLVVLGGAAWVAAGRRTLVAFAGVSAALYLVVAAFTMNVLSAARYGLPALALSAMLAAGVAAAPWRWARRAGVAALGCWCAAAFAWGLPVYLMRRQPAPVWSALEWIRSHRAPHNTVVVYDGIMTPHVLYVLGRSGYELRDYQDAGERASEPVLGKDLVYVTQLPMPRCDVLYSEAWDDSRLGPLTFRRYASCVVSRPPGGESAVFSPDWQVTPTGWRLWGTGRIRLPQASTPAVARVCAGREKLGVRVPAGPLVTLAPGACTMATLLPGPGGELTVIAPTNAPAVMPPIALLPLSALDPSVGLSTAYMVPQAARTRGFRGVRWQTDLVVINPQRQPLGVAAQFLPTARDNPGAPAVAATLAPGEARTLGDVLSLPQLASAGEFGALLVYAGAPGAACASPECRFLVLSRTYSTPASGVAWRASEWMPGVPASETLVPGGDAKFSHVTRTNSVGASIGVASWTDAPVWVRAEVRDAGGAVVEVRELALERFGHLHVPVRANVRDGAVVVRLDGGPEDAMVVPYVSMVDHQSGLPTHLLPDAMPEHPLPVGWRPPLPGVARFGAAR